ncbi:hypothetical protein A8H28_29470 [Burkholderia gladioli pv. gladioli]|nr:hypothetical protein A8H28_29470 [Burkholderia gladioli pv. gladioli]
MIADSSVGGLPVVFSNASLISLIAIGPSAVFVAMWEYRLLIIIGSRIGLIFASRSQNVVRRMSQKSICPVLVEKSESMIDGSMSLIMVPISGFFGTQAGKSVIVLPTISENCEPVSS